MSGQVQHISKQDNKRILYAHAWHARKEDPRLHLKILAYRFAKQAGAHHFRPEPGYHHGVCFHQAVRLAHRGLVIQVPAEHLVLWDHGDPPVWYGNTSEPWSTSWFQVRGRMWRELLRELDLPMLTPLALPGPAAIQRCIFGLHQELVAHQDLDAEILQAHLGILLREARRCRRGGEVVDIDKRLLWARGHLERNLDRVVPLARLARDQGLSPRHLARRFVAAWGMTPDAYHQQLRAAYAISLIERGDLLLAEVAQRLGYATPFAFSKAFKRWTGHSPGAYRHHRPEVSGSRR